MSLRKQSVYFDLVGQTKEYLTIISCQRSPRDDRRYELTCQCKCGQICNKWADSVKKGITTSCGCRRDQYNKIRGKNNRKYTGYEEISGKFWKCLLASAKNREYKVIITIQEAWMLFIKQERKCALSGLILKLPTSQKHDKWSYATASLDRIDSKKDYTVENCQWIHKDINLMKQSYTQEYFLAMCNLIGQNNPINYQINIEEIERGDRYGGSLRKQEEKYAI